MRRKRGGSIDVRWSCRQDDCRYLPATVARCAPHRQQRVATSEPLSPNRRDRGPQPGHTEAPRSIPEAPTLRAVALPGPDRPSTDTGSRS